MATLFIKKPGEAPCCDAEPPLALCRDNNFPEEAQIYASEALTNEPFSFLPNPEEKALDWIHQKTEETFQACFPEEAFNVHLFWHEMDAKKIATILYQNQRETTEIGIRFLRQSTDLTFLALILSALTLDQNGAHLAGSFLSMLKDPLKGVSILYEVKNPAKAARILNNWEYFEENPDLITTAFAKRNFPILEKGASEDESTYRHRIFLTYYGGVTLDADTFYADNPLEGVRKRDQILSLLDVYENARMPRSQEDLLDLLRASQREGILKDFSISFKPDGKTEDFSCSFLDTTTQKSRVIQKNIDSLNSEQRICVRKDRVLSDAFSKILSEVFAKEGLPPLKADHTTLERWAGLVAQAVRKVIADKELTDAMCTVDDFQHNGNKDKAAEIYLRLREIGITVSIATYNGVWAPDIWLTQSIDGSEYESSFRMSSLAGVPTLFEITVKSEGRVAKWVGQDNIVMVDGREISVEESPKITSWPNFFKKIFALYPAESNP